MCRIVASRVSAAVIALVAATFLSGQILCQSDEIATLNRQIAELFRAGKYSEAIPPSERSLQLTRAQRGEEHLDTTARMNVLARLYHLQGRLAEAEPLFKRALELRE
jgi:tetratricopeptide (TPR) repeat protein